MNFAWGVLQGEEMPPSLIADTEEIGETFRDEESDA